MLKNRVIFHIIEEFVKNINEQNCFFYLINFKGEM